MNASVHRNVWLGGLRTTGLMASVAIVMVVGCRGKQPPAGSPTPNNPSPASAHYLTSTYIGSAACAECHQDITEQFQNHSMGRSLSPIASAADVESFTNEADSSFNAGGFRYAVVQRDGKMFHRQSRVAEDGGELAVINQAVDFVIGSGHHGRSYVVNHDGYLFMSPITWYPDKGVWDLSPGYEKKNSQFNRPIIETCLFCHANRVHRVPHTANRYQQPVFEGHAIGCERCHGPAQQHVALHRGENMNEGDVDPIVNPANLDHDLREAVCQQCHLSGAARVLKPGKSLFDFRPGQALDSCFSVFVLREDLTTGDKFVGQVEEMYQSRCYQASDGDLGCISCHDPHRLPKPDERIAYYRQRCLQCHPSDGCGLEETRRRETNADDDCVACHMPRRKTEVRHASLVNHRIPKNTADLQDPLRKNVPRAALPVIRFSSGAQTATELDRDLAIAVLMASASHPELVEPRHVKRTLPVLERATRANPDDLDAFEFLGQAYLTEGRPQDAFEAFEHVLQRQPQREVSLAVVADLLNAAGQHRQAIGYWRRAVQVNPWMSRYWYGLAQAYDATGQWQLCRDTVQKAAARFPTSIGARQLMVESYLRLGEHQRAEQAFQWLERYHPRGMDSLSQWYQSHPNRQD